MSGPNRPTHYPVVVVGAGPAGLVAASALASQGVETLLVERRTGDPSDPRATVLSLRTMELLRAWRLEDLVLAGSDDVEMTLLETPSLARASEGRSARVGYLSPAESTVLSPTAAACVAQDHLERVLLDHLATLPAATVVRGVEVDEVTGGADEATVVLTDRSTGVRHTVSAAYVIGADGARSRVRSGLGVRMVGPDSIFGEVRTEFRGPVWEVVGEHRHLLYFITHPEAQGVMLPAGQGDRWMFGVAQDSGEVPFPDPDLVRRQIELAVGVPGLPMSISHTRRFTSGAQIAERFHVGNVFLAGDAAHRITPRGGTGLNTAIADGWDLGWKLGWVLRHWAPPSLLASYEAERRVPVAHNVERSADPLGSRRGPDTEVRLDLGGRIRHVWTKTPTGDAAGSFRSTLDLVGAGLTLFTGGDTAGWRRAAETVSDAATLPPVSVVSLEDTAAAALGVGHGGAVLVRPDAVPVGAWWSSSDPALDLRRSVGSFLDRSLPFARPASGSAA